MTEVMDHVVHVYRLTLQTQMFAFLPHPPLIL